MDSLLRDDFKKAPEYRKPPFWEKSKGQVFIYGTGRFAQDIQHTLEQKGIAIAGFIDHRGVENRSNNSPPVFYPDDPAISKRARSNSIVLVGIHNREAKVLSILDNLERLGYGEIVTPVDLYDYLQEDLGVRYWLTARAYYLSHTATIEAASKLFKDARSRASFTSILRFRLTGDYSLLPAPDAEHQYLAPDLPRWPGALRFVDCGAYNGNTLASFLRAGYQFQAVAAFEPDPENFRKLSFYISQNQKMFPHSSLFPYGVYSSTTQLMFETGGGEASKISQTGTTMIQCTSLDESIPAFAPNLIKIDIEGVEMEAVLGAEQVIKTHQPALAISIYHVPGHIWEIPLCINRFAQEANLHYTYHLRIHAQNGFETVFYAIPERQTTSHG